MITTHGSRLALRDTDTEPKKLTTITYNGQGATCAPSTVLVDGKPPAVVCTRTEQATTMRLEPQALQRPSPVPLDLALHLHHLRPGADRHRSEQPNHHHQLSPG